MTGYVNQAITPQQEWWRVNRGYHECLTTDGTRLYVSRTRYGWAYGLIVDGHHRQLAETTRPIKRAQVLAERAAAERATS